MPVEPAAAEEHFLERGPTLTKRISLDDSILPAVEPVRSVQQYGLSTGEYTVDSRWNVSGVLAAKY